MFLIEELFHVGAQLYIQFFVCVKEDIFSIKEDLTVSVQGKPSHLGHKQPDPEEQQVN